MAWPSVVTACASISYVRSSARTVRAAAVYARRLRVFSGCIVQRRVRSRLVVSYLAPLSMRRRASVSVGGVAVRRDRKCVGIACTQLTGYRAHGGCASSAAASYGDACWQQHLLVSHRVRPVRCIGAHRSPSAARPSVVAACGSSSYARCSVRTVRAVAVRTRWLHRTAMHPVAAHPCRIVMRFLFDASAFVSFGRRA